MKRNKSNLSNWTNENRDLLRNIKGQYVAFNESGIIANAKTLKSLVTKAAWMQDQHSTDEIIGREVVFDKFDIEFKQADEQIIFKWRG